MARVLIADDEPSICDAFRLLLEKDGHTPLIAPTGEEALRLVRDEHPDLVFVDVRMPGMDGLAVLKEIGRFAPALPVVVMTAHGSLETASEAMRHEAFDYLGKPLDLAHVRRVIGRALHASAISRQIRNVPLAGPSRQRPTLVGQSAAMQELFKLIVMLADNDLTVLVQGESGVGKELVARAIHESGTRQPEPFIGINCAAIPEQLLESELFGHERGAFTDAKAARTGRFEAAGQGTLFLDEISELPLHLQSKLLRVLQERSFERVGGLAAVPLRARLICASNRDIASAVAAGAFREDLYHRLNIVTLQVPPLRERLDDIPELVQALIQCASRDIGKTITSVEQEVLDTLRNRDWYGNVRELEHVIKRSVLVAREPTLTIHDLRFDQDFASPANAAGSLLDNLLRRLDAHAVSLVNAARHGETEVSVHELAIRRLEQALIQAALAATEGNQVAAARLLGVSRSTLRSKLTN